MLITNQLFYAYLKCPTKCFLYFRSEVGDNNAYSEWFRIREQAYLDKYLRLFMHDMKHEYAFSPDTCGHLKTAKWNFGINLPVSTQKLEAVIQIVERVPMIQRNQHAQLIPIRFTFVNKLPEVISCGWHSIPWFYRKSLDIRFAWARLSTEIIIKC